MVPHGSVAENLASIDARSVLGHWGGRMLKRAEGAGDPASQPSTTLVTGAAGFIGSHVVRGLLDSGRRVIGLDVKDFSPEGRFVLADAVDEVPLELGSVADLARLTDVMRWYRPDEIVHMGMIIDADYLATNRTSGFQVNVLGTVNVLEAMLTFDVARMVNMSSIGVLPSIEYEPVDASHPVLLPRKGPASGFYGSQKASSELLCFAYHHAFGLDFRTIRPSAVYGLGMTPWPGPIKELVEHASRGEPRHVPMGGQHPRDYTHAYDIASLVVAALDAPDDADRIFYGATGRPLITTSKVVEIIRDLIPGADVSIGEGLSEGERYAVENLRGRLSIENARDQLGWEPSYGAVEDGIAQYIEHYRAFLESKTA
jgi:nucleoside-diphosphate-sugar epimerase